MFADREDAGRQLAERLQHLAGSPVVVLGLPRGGVPVAAPVAESLDAPLDVLVVRKLRFPGQPELALGAVGEEGVRLVDEQLVRCAGLSEAGLRAVEAEEVQLLRQRVDRLRSGRPRVPLRGRVAVVVDDGLATGSTARAGCTVARRLGAVRVALAVPVAPLAQLGRLPEADEVVCVHAPDRFRAVGLFYRDFRPTPEDEVVQLLDAAAGRVAGD